MHFLPLGFMNSSAGRVLRSVVFTVLLCALLANAKPQELALAQRPHRTAIQDWHVDTYAHGSNNTSKCFPHSILDAVPNNLQQLLDGHDAAPHKKLWPLDGNDLLVFIIASISVFIAAGGGIGGGGVLVPLYLLAGRFSTPESVALSNITIMGGAIANFICNVPRKHPKVDRPLIDWDLILVMEPTTIIGAIFGGYMNKLLPVWLTTVLLAVLLTFMTQKLLAKGCSTFQAETRLLQLEAAVADSDSSPTQPLLEAQPDTPKLLVGGGQKGTGEDGGESEEDFTAEATGSSSSSVHAIRIEDGIPLGIPVSELNGWNRENDAAITKLLKHESEQVPLVKLVVLLFISVWVVTSDTLKESIKCGSWGYWAVVLSILPVVALVTVEMRRYLLWKVGVKHEAGYDTTAGGELNWTPVTTIVYPTICSLAGLVAGLFGVGGGIVKGPLMLELGVAPEVAAATAATMIMFTAGAASIVYIHFGGVLWDYAIPLFVVGFVMTFVGQMLTYRIISTLGRRSVIIFMMATLMVMASVVMYYQVVRSLLHHDSKEPWWHIGHICPNTAR